MGHIVISAGQNPPQPTATTGIFLVECSAACEGIATGFSFTVTVDINGANPVPGMRDAIKNEAISQVLQLGGSFGGGDKVVSLVDPRIN